MDNQGAGPHQKPPFSQPEPAVPSNIEPEDLNMYLPPSRRKKPKWPKVLGIIIASLVILALAFGAYWKFFRGTNNQTAPPPKSTQPAKPKITSKSYDSSNFNLSFTYPSDWKINDTAKELTVTSPSVQLTDATNQPQTGRIVISVQPKGTVPPPIAKNGAVTVLGSYKMTYKNPSSVQRGQTYLSYLQYPATTANGALDGIYITGDFGYQKNQYVPVSDVEKLDPLIIVSFETCNDAKCATPTPLSISSDNWQSVPSQATVRGILESIRVNIGS